MFDGQGRRKYLTENERKAFLHLAAQEPDPLRRSFCLVLFYTGCRISEALALTGSRIDVAQGCIVFETLKRRRKGVFRAVPVPDELIRLLESLKIEPAKPVWPLSRSTAFRLVKGLLRQAGIEGVMCCPKGLRHGFGVACVGRNIPLTKVQKWLGHARLETTAIYLDVSGDEERQLARRLWT